MRIDLSTTSVGRDTLVRTYESFFARVCFSGSFRVLVTVDPAYRVPSEELRRTTEYLRELPRRHPQVEEVVVEVLPRQVGLQKALGLLFAHACAPVGMHLEDDWEITNPFDLDGLIADLGEQDSSAIVFANEHVAMGGTFERPDEVVEVVGTRVPLRRLVGASWAKHYMPLCPHVHVTDRWMPAVARALLLTDDLRCPDERVREMLIAEDSLQAHNVLWTKNILARDIGREWLAERSMHKAITAGPPREAEPAPALPPVARGPLALERSAALRKRAERLIPGVTQTFQKRPENFAEGRYPVYLERGDGALVWDVDGNCYLDFVGALGTATLGHNHPAVTTAVRERAGRGVLLSLPSPSELTVAELITSAVQGVDMVRFLKTGADACSAAIRLARHALGRDGVVLAGYHGWHDQLGVGGPGVFAGAAAPSTRVALDSAQDDARLLRIVRDRGAEVAAVVLSTPYHRTLDRKFLVDVREACDDTGALLVLDEVVTGFRLAPGGLGEVLGVRADLVCFGKGLAAGMPLAALGGPAALMREFAALHVSTTFGGELLSLEVAKAVLREYARGGYYRQVAELGRRFARGVNERASEEGLGHIVVGYDPMPCLRLAPESAIHARRAEDLLAACARRGVLLRRDVNFVSAAHTPEQIDYAAEAIGVALAELARGWPR